MIIPLTYFFLLPHLRTFSDVAFSSEVEQDVEYTPLPVHEAEEEVEEEDLRTVVERPDKLYNVTLSLQDKWTLVKPLLMKYMLPLCELLM